MSETNKPVALILAAGTSKRMKKLKPFLSYDENRTFLDKILFSFFTFGCQEAWIVLNKQGMEQASGENYYKNVHLVMNEHPEKERFHSLQTGLKHIAENTPVFLHNADNPFISQITLEQLWNAYHANGVVIPEFIDKGGHPILLAPEIVRDVVNEDNEKLLLNEFLKKYEQFRIPVTNPEILVNINTTEEYQKYFGKVLK